MFFTFTFLVFAFLFCCLPRIESVRKGMVGDDLSVITERIVDSYMLSVDWNQNQKDVETYLSHLESNGKFDDVDYTDKSRAVWKTIDHLYRTASMSLGYASPESKLYHNNTILSKTLLALDFWLTNDYQNPNWWFNQIGTPIQIGEISLLVANSLNTNEINKCKEIMARANWDGWTGENTVWMAEIHIHSGCLTKNLTYVSEAFKKIYETVTITSGESDGIKEDGSFFQHGSLLQSGTYGSDFSSDITEVSYLSHNTSLNITNSAINAISVSILDGQQYMIVNRYFDVACKGREITRAGDLKCGWNSTYVGDMPGNRHEEYVAFANRLDEGDLSYPLIGNRHYWISDYMVHRRKGWMASVKMYSKRTYNAECVNDEGVKSVHLSDGANYVYLDGSEYWNIFPVWDWRRIPGITAEDNGLELECSKVKTKGKTDFVGGVSDGNYGVTCYQFEAPFSGTTTGLKSYFFFDDVYVGLGNSFSCKSNNPVSTTLNQCLLKGDVHISSQNSALEKGNHSFTDLKWVHHNNIGYLFTDNVNVGLENDVRSGKWSDIGAGSSDVVNMDVFTLFIHHEKVPVNDVSYAYYVVPNIDFKSFNSTSQTFLDKLDVIKNDGNVQAVLNKESNVLGVVFWKGGSVSVNEGSSYTINVNTSCALLVKESSDSFLFTVSNPQQFSSTNEVELKFSGSLKNSDDCKSLGGSTTINFSLPTGSNIGKSMSIKCSK